MGSPAADHMHTAGPWFRNGGGKSGRADERRVFREVHEFPRAMLFIFDARGISSLSTRARITGHAYSLVSFRWRRHQTVASRATCSRAPGSSNK
jgi:hypothetical protein